MHWPQATASLAVAVIAIVAGCGSPPGPGNPAPSPSSVGPRLVITKARGCPATMRGQLISHAPDSGSVLAPSRPTGGLVCRYSSLNFHGGLRLLASARLSAAQARHLADLLSNLPASQGAVSCPADDGAADIIVLDYAHQTSAMVQAGLSGCGIVTNGWFGRGSTPDLDGDLAALAGRQPA
jgi:hypothetical protein